MGTLRIFALEKARLVPVDLSRPVPQCVMKNGWPVETDIRLPHDLREVRKGEPGYVHRPAQPERAP